MPSECKYPRALTEGSGKAVGVDMIAEYYKFRHAYKCEPGSWRDFRYGIEELPRIDAQMELRIATAARVAQDTKGEQFEKYHRRLSIEAGYTRMN